MFARIKHGGNRKHPHDYLQIVESYREDGKPKQRVIANLGRFDKLVDSGRLDDLIEKLARFSRHVRVLSRARTPKAKSCRAKLWGPPLVFGRLWQRQRVDSLIERLARGRRFGFDVERVVFAMALGRLCRPGSDLQASRWVKTVEAPGFDAIQLQHLYRTTGFLHDVRDELERELFVRDRDLFSQDLDLLFIDTTSLYVYRDTQTDWRKRGYSRDRRGDLPQLVLCVAVNRDGWPVAFEVFPGNTMDRVAFKTMIDILRSRLKVRRVIVVADRAMIGKDTIKLLTESEDAPFDYILGCRMRGQKEVRQDVLSRAGRYRTVAGNLRVKEVVVDDRRYVVCLNPARARKDAAKRIAIVQRLEEKIRREPKAVVKHAGYKRFALVTRDSIRIDRAAVAADARLDGKFVLRTNTDLPADEVAVTYKSLWRVERIFREAKCTLAVRPIFHHRDDTSIGHIVASFLALRLEVDLQRRLDEHGIDVSWPDLMQDLEQVQAVDLTLDGRRWRVRTDLAGQAHAAFRAAGVRPPSRIAPLPEQEV